MNAPFPTRATSVDWEVCRGDFYIVEPSDFPEGCGIVFNPDTGKQFGVGKNKLGLTVKLQLYHPICSGCDEPIAANGLCDNCYVLHADVAS